jgi:hypothetical protein
MGQPKYFMFKSANNVTYKLTEKEKKFCELYSQFGASGIDAVIKAGYKAKTNNTAYSIASENLRKPKILAYVNLLYKTYNFTDEEVMREHWFLIKQHQSLSNKARAIDMFYKKMGFYSPGKQESDVAVVRKYEEMTDAQLESALSRRVAAR